VDQRQRIEELCERESLVLVDVLEEINVSGGAPLERRPGLREAVERIEAGDAEVLVTAFLDRLARDLIVQRAAVERIEANGGEVLTADAGLISSKNPTAKVTSGMLGMISEWQREIGAVKTAAAKRLAVEAGRPPFPLPRYLKKGADGKIEHNQKLVKLLRTAIQMRLDGATLRQIRAYLRERGFEISEGGLQNTFRSKLLLGELHFGEHSNTDAFHEVIDAETFQRLQEVRIPRGRRSKSERLLARLRILRCGTCDSPLQVGTSKTTYAVYKCSNVECARRVSISAQVAESELSEFTRKRIAGMKGTTSNADRLARAELELEKLSQKYDSAIEILAEHDDVAAAKQKLGEIRQRRDAKRRERDELRQTLGSQYVLDAYRNWDSVSFDGRRALIRIAVETATVAPGRGFARIADRIAIEPRQV
jgi:putative DNA-invertase from lambdoid prophage Rac